MAPEGPPLGSLQAECAGNPVHTREQHGKQPHLSHHNILLDCPGIGLCLRDGGMSLLLHSDLLALRLPDTVLELVFQRICRARVDIRTHRAAGRSITTESLVTAVFWRAHRVQYEATMS